MINTDSLPYAIPLFAVVLLAAGIFFRLITDRGRGLTLSIIWVLILGAGWSLGYAFEILFVEIKWKIASAVLQYPFIYLTPVAWLLFAAKLAGLRDRVTKKTLMAILAIPLLMQPVIWTNSYHHLFWETMRLRTQGSVSVLEFSYGPLFWLGNVYSFGLILTAVAAIVYLASRIPNASLAARLILIVAPLAPLLANIVYTQRWGPLPNIDMTPFTFALSGVLLGYGLVFRQLDQISFEFRFAESEQRIRSALDSAKTGTLYWRETNGAAELNDEAKRLLNITADDVATGRDEWLRNVHQDDAEMVRSQYSTFLTSENAIELTFRTIRASGEVRYLETQLSCVRNTDNQLVQISGLVRDVSGKVEAENQLRVANELAQKSNKILQTELELRKKIENQLNENEASLEKVIHERTEELRNSEQRIRLLLDSTMEGIIGLDNQGNCTFCNAAGLKMLGRNIDEILQKSIHALIHHTRPDGLTNLLQDCKICNVDYQSGPVHSDDQVFWRLDNTGFATECWSHPIRDNDELVGSVIIFLDIEHRLRQREQELYLQDQLRHSQKMEAIGAFSSGIAHDFNNILNGLAGCLELAVDSASDEAERQSYLDDALKSTRIATDLVDQILFFSRKEDVEKSAINLPEILRSTLKLLRRTIPTSVSIDAVFEVEEAWINANGTQLRQVILNIFSNSVAAIGVTQGKIDLLLEEFDGWSELESTYRRSKSPRYLKITIHDSGCGIPDNVIGRIFEPLYTTKKSGVGTGLGLSIVYSIIQDHSGFIDIVSTPGNGTTVTIYFPKAKLSSPGANLKPAALNIKEVSGKILLVDDDPTTRRVFRAALEKIGCDVVTMNDGESAFAVYSEACDEFDLVITDETMPRMTGATLADEILKLRNDQPIILCTGYSMAIDEKQAAALGISRFLMKPVSLHVLVEVAQDILFDAQQER